MLVATYHKGSKSLTYWTKTIVGNQIRREYCDSQVVAKLTVMEQTLKNKLSQKLIIER